MKAMVLAAGVGSRLRPITDSVPKALVEVGGTPMLEIVIRRLMKAGVDQIVINVFHKPEAIEDFLRDKRNFGIRVELSREERLLDTGGGLKNAAAFFDDGRPFFLHNADIFSELDLARLYRSHEETGALATLAVHPRGAPRRFVFDKDGLLRGWESDSEGRRWAGAPAKDAEAVNFDAIHVLSPAIFPKMTETGAFSMVDAYLRLAAEGEAIRAFRSDGAFWATVGDARQLEALRARAREKGLAL